MNGSIFLTTKVPWPGRVSTSPRVVSHLIASRTVFRDAPWSFSQLEFGPQLLAGLEYSRLDLLAQLFGDLPVHRICHRPSSLLDLPLIGVIPPVQTTQAI